MERVGEAMGMRERVTSTMASKYDTWADIREIRKV